ncbi:MAG: hypothetical protein ABFD96_06070 [Armatimonadia bacterium]
MSESPTPKKPRRPKPGNHSPEIRARAFDLWIEAGRCDFRELVDIVKDKLGITVENSTLTRWKDANPAWLAAFQDKYRPLDPSKALAALKQAKDDAKALEPEHLIGIKAQLIARLYLAIRDMKIPSIDEWERALNCCDRIEALIHAERGKTIGEPGTGAQSLVDRLNPPVKLAAFKKPAAAANGSTA